MKLPHEPKKQTLKGFLKEVRDNKANNIWDLRHFPTDELLEEYLGTIHTRTETEVKNLLRYFLVKNEIGQYSRLMKDTYNGIETGKTKAPRGFFKAFSRLKKTEYYRRLMNVPQPNWEGLTWVLDLLPHSPNEAIRGISAYNLANFQFLTDNLIHTLSDCMAIIRAYYLEKEHPHEALQGLEPRDFEFLTAELYSEMGYEITLTKKTRDGGFDIHAEKNDPDDPEKFLIECKTSSGTIGVEVLTRLLGVVSSKKYPNGILVTNSKFSKPAINFAKENPRLKLVPYPTLMRLLNKHYGPFWNSKVDTIILRQKEQTLPK